MIKYLYSLIFSVICFVGFNSQELKSYQFYNKNKEKIDYGTLIQELKKYDIVLFGEYHNNSIQHWLELRVGESLYEIFKDKLVIGAEMFERDNQQQINKYINGEIDEDKFLDSVRLWDNYNTDYKPILELAKENKLKFIATNIPKKYASQVSKEGLKSLNKLDKKELEYIARLPIKIDYNAPGYPQIANMMKEHDPNSDANKFVEAQAIKDATMAQSIINNLNYKKGIFIHYNGDYHSKGYGGIYWYLKKQKPRLKIAVISILETDQKDNLDMDKALIPDDFSPTDFILVTPADMINTF